MGRVFNFRSGCMHIMHLLPGVAIQPNLELKTRPKQLLGSLPLAIALDARTFSLGWISSLGFFTKELFLISLVPGKVVDPFFSSLRPLRLVENERFRPGPEKSGLSASLQKFETCGQCYKTFLSVIYGFLN